jgi:hypothetical protein
MEVRYKVNGVRVCVIQMLVHGGGVGVAERVTFAGVMRVR